ncbi:Zn-ribbon domain-containing OB-fold protein [Chachezhania sediminis]|uniref:Zn-ribbon domain-containing OB-fold protein n=1 Tax=Chachezhania sediminis TaxID=2599291 RepID=UPI00131B5332|nr:zinc ribbon domain-containing protein [Chachezhania sediminis]
MKLEKPDLCAPGAGHGTHGPRLVLKAGLCAACGQVHFPKTEFGCPRCGAAPDRVALHALDGAARLLAFATIHTRLSPLITPPCVVGEAEVAPGIVEEVMLVGDEMLYADGMALRAVGIPVARGDRQLMAIRFEPAEDAA